MMQSILRVETIIVIFNVFLLCNATQISSLRGWTDLEIHSDMKVPSSDWVSRETQNINQCLRLCWLFKSCQTISYTPQGNMCHLHPSQGGGVTPNMIPDSTSVVVRMSEALPDKSSSELRGCDTRPCTESQMCAPAKRKGYHMCLQMFTVMCQEPTAPPTHATATSDGFYMMTYNCVDGYAPLGSKSVSTCDRSTGRWSTIDLVCVYVDCGDPPSVAGAKASNFTDTTYNVEVTYTCYDGAVSTSPSMTIRCQATGDWTSPPEPCRIVSCGNPVSTESTEIVVLPRSSTNPYPGLTDDELAMAYGGQANHTCKTGYEWIGTKYFISECLEDGNWTMPNRFSCPAVDCGPPPTMANASVSTSGTVYRSIASYICDTGYETDQSPLRISCGEDGTWTNVSAVCQPVDCGRPTPLDHAEVDYTSTTLGSEVTDTCIYQLLSVSETNSTRVCEESGNWTVSSLTCVFVQCGLPPDVDHATVKMDKMPGAFIAIYTCDTGYEFPENIIFNSNKLCLVFATTWTTNYVGCEIVNCGEPPPVENATFNVTGLTYMSTVTYTCDTGFKLDTDHNNRTCLDTGNWSVEDVECVGITCPQLPDVENAHVKTITDGINYGSVVSYECNNDTVLITPTSNITCLSDGWETTPIRCDVIPCGDPPFVTNSTREVVYSFAEQVIKAVYTCSYGYDLRTREINASICDNHSRSWSDEEIFCDIIDCGTPPELANASFRIDTTTLGSTVHYDCSPGFYMLNNVSKRTCQLDGTWSPENISCNIIDCGNPPEEPKASLVFTDTTYSSIASYTCQPGYTTSSREPRYIKCTENGVWNVTDNSHQEHCTLVDCGPPDSVENGTITLTNTSYRGSAVYACDYGFVLSGSDEKTCNESGIWDGDENLECLTDVCISPPVVANAVVDSFRDVSFEVVAKYRCLYGFHLIGDKLLTCLRKQNWTQESFWCRRINCGMPPSLPNSAVSFQNTTIDSVATYTCLSGYYLLDNVSQKSCTSDEKWSDDHVECVEIGQTVCPVPPDVHNAVAVYTSRQPNSRARYVCKEGYEHRWFESYTCLSTGMWLSYLISCKPKDCGVPPDVVNASKVYSSTSYGDSVRYTCSLGTRHVGITDRKVCTADGTWSSYLVECLSDDVVICGPPPFVANAESRYTSTEEGSYATYMCKPGYTAITIASDFKAKCEADGTWHGFSGPCSPVTCDSPPAVENADIVGTEFTYGARVTYICRDGFMHTGTDMKTCEDYGRWSDETVECVESLSIYCFDPPQFDNAQIQFTSRKMGADASYSCLPGYNNGFATLTCSSSGLWSGTFNPCEPLHCDSIPNKNNAINPSDGISYQSVTLLKCNAGFTPVHPYRSYCLENGTWSHVEGNCTEVQPDTSVHCSPDPPDVALAEKSFTHTYAGSVVNYKCHVGYSSLGFEDPFRTCLETGQWSDEMIQCQETICLEVPSLANANFASLSYAYDTTSVPLRKTVTASYECMDGYVIPTSTVTVPVPLFDTVFYDDPVVADPVTQTNQDNPINPNTIKVDCHFEQGWSTADISCQPKSCGIAPDFSNSIQTGNDTTFSAKVVYTCELPYFLVGSNNVTTCQANGDWSDVDFTCEPCNQDPNIANGYLEIQRDAADSYGYMATHRCDEKYTLVGPSLIVCEGNGIKKPSWNYSGNSECVRHYWGNPTMGFKGRFYLEGVTSSILACAIGFYTGNQKVVVSMQEELTSAAARGFRPTFRMNYLGSHEELVIASKVKGEDMVEHGVLHFALSKNVEYTICIDMDLIERVYTLFVNGENATSLAFQPNIDHGGMKYFTVFNDFRLKSVNITYN